MRRHWMKVVFSVCIVACLPLRMALAEPAIPARGTLYRVTQSGHVAWLFGTVHVGQASFYPLEPVVMRALAGAGTLALELDPTDQPALQAAFARHGMLPPPRTLDKVVSATTLAQVRQVLAGLGVPFDAVSGLQPWALANALLALALERSGFVREQGIEVHLLAQAAGKPVVALETADSQLGLFETLDAAQQETYLVETLEAIREGKVAQQSREMITAWGRADGATLERLLREELAEPTVTADFTKRVLLEQRNPLLTASIRHLMTRETSSFVAIGLLHLIGDDGVPARLQRSGYRVEKLY